MTACPQRGKRLCLLRAGLTQLIRLRRLELSCQSSVRIHALVRVKFAEQTLSTSSLNCSTQRIELQGCSHFLMQSRFILALDFMSAAHAALLQTLRVQREKRKSGSAETSWPDEEAVR